MYSKISMCCLLSTVFVGPTLAATTGALFDVSSAGTVGKVEMTLCLNGVGELSCQLYRVTSLNMTIRPVIANHVYPRAGIKIHTPGYVLTGCTAYKNGYCLFSTSREAPSNVVLSNTRYEMVRVANPGNANDTTGFGSVDYVYDIGKYHVTIKQYTDFLNAVAKTDAYDLYHPSMGVDLNSAGIRQTGRPGEFTYSVMDNGGVSANRPITYVTWFNAARFANWMANGQPSGVQDDTTTEDGAYALHGAVSGVAVAKNQINPNTNAAPTFYIPLENEWYKAAYYDPTLHGVGGYYLYATRHDSQPGNHIGEDENQANYFIASAMGFSVTQSLLFEYSTQNYLTDVGAFSSSTSFYGTFDQNGNADQWNDLDGMPSPLRGLRGGFFYAGLVPLKSILYATSATINAYNGGGFRLASPVLATLSSTQEHIYHG